MEAIKVLLDNDTANRIAELDEEIASKVGKSNTSDRTYIEDRDYLRKIIEIEKRGLIRLYSNLWGQWEGYKTTDKDKDKRQAILREYEERRFTEYNSTTFPILWFKNKPAKFLSAEEKGILNQIFEELPRKYRHDIKALAEALFDPIKFEYFLTCTTKHLAAKALRNKIEEKGLKLRICTPREFYEEVVGRLI